MDTVIPFAQVTVTSITRCNTYACQTTSSQPVEPIGPIYNIGWWLKCRGGLHMHHLSRGDILAMRTHSLHLDHTSTQYCRLHTAGSSLPSRAYAHNATLKSRYTILQIHNTAMLATTPALQIHAAYCLPPTSIQCFILPTEHRQLLACYFSAITPLFHPKFTNQQATLLDTPILLQGTLHLHFATVERSCTICTPLPCASNHQVSMQPQP